MDQLSLDDLQRKACTKCGEVKDLDQFSIRHYSTGKPHPWCKACVTAQTRAWAKAHPERRRVLQRRARLKRAGISGEEYDRRLSEQAGRCAICRTDIPGHTPDRLTFDVDHSHATGAIRGLLCQGCNLGIGQLGDDPARLRVAAAYLERFL